MMVDECMDSMGITALFSAMGASPCYWQIETDEREMYETAFMTNISLYRYTRVSFTQRKPSSRCQKSMDVLLATVKWQDALVSIDYLIIFSSMSEDHT